LTAISTPLRLLIPKVAWPPVREKTSPMRMVSPEGAACAGEPCGAGAVPAGTDFFSQPTANSATAADVAARSVLMGEPLSKHCNGKAGVF
jgi:hypothetical protein